MQENTVSLRDIQEAMERIRPHIHATEIGEVSLPSGEELLIKTESMQVTGSFKTRGAFNCIMQLGEAERQKGVIAASAGNHAQGVAKAARAFGIACTIVMPKTAPLAKISAVEGYGARVVLDGDVFDDAYATAVQMQAESGAALISAFDDARIVAGQGTIGLEIARQAPDLEVLLVPVGGGGLAAGIAVAVKELLPHCRIFGVEPESAASMQASVRAGRVVTLASAATIADGIAVKTPGELPFAICKRLLDGILTVDDDEIANAMLYLIERAKMVSEGAGAAAMAAALHNKTPLRGKKAMAILSGGNIDPTMISRIIDKGLAKAGRKILIKVLILDRPGQLSALLDLVSGTGANVVSIHHDRIRTDVAIGSTVVELELETRDRAHALMIQTMLEENRYRIMT